MAIQPCHYCGKPVRSAEYFCHNVVCTDPACVDRKREADARMQAALDAARK